MYVCVYDGRSMLTLTILIVCMFVCLYDGRSMLTLTILIVCMFVCLYDGRSMLTLTILIVCMFVCVYDGNVNLSPACIKSTRDWCHTRRGSKLVGINVIEICFYILTDIFSTYI